MGVIKAIRSDFEQKGHHGLFASLLLVILVNPVALEAPRLKWLFTLFLMLVLLAAVRTVALNSRNYYIELGLGASALLLQIGGFMGTSAWWMFARNLAILLFLVLACIVLLRNMILRGNRVNADLILGSINIYLMAGLAFSMLYAIIEQLQPGSFSGSGSGGEAVAGGHFIYFSFITLTTLGYGDITPLTPVGATIAFIEAIFGQMYIAILVARLVGTYIVRSTADLKKE